MADKKDNAHDEGFKAAALAMEFIIGSWLHEVDGEVTEAIKLLDPETTGNTWWAEHVRNNFMKHGGPAINVPSDGEAGTIIEIAFWSGWLKGEQETLTRLHAGLLDANGGLSRLMQIHGQAKKQENDFRKGLR